MKPPHILLASSNVRRLQSNLSHLVDGNAQAVIESEIARNVRQLFLLGRGHFLFATRQHNRNWRQKVSRLYYGAYNVSRALRLCVDGDYSTDITDHKKVSSLPQGFPNKNTYENKLGSLREDRNTCDYDHTAEITDLIWAPDDSAEFVSDFLNDARTFLTTRGVTI